MDNRPLFFTLIIVLFLGILPSSAQSNTVENKSVTDLIAKKRSYNKENGYGFRIQLYNGLESKAKTIRAKFRIEFPKVFTVMGYDEPDWKIQVGNYKTKLEADKFLNTIKEKFTGAIVVPL